MKTMKRCLSLLLAMVMVFSLFPAPIVGAAEKAPEQAATAPQSEPAKLQEAAANEEPTPEEPEQVSNPNPIKADRAFTLQPDSGSIAPGGYCKFTWATNFTPTKIKIVSEYHNYYGYKSDRDILAELPGTRTSHTLSYDTVEMYRNKWSDYFQDFRVYAYYSKDEYIPSEPFHPEIVARSFTTQPLSGITLTPRDKQLVKWSTNFQPTKIKIVSSCFTVEDVLAELPGTRTDYVLSYEEAEAHQEHWTYGQGLHVYAYYSDDEYVSSEVFRPVLAPRAFTAEPQSGVSVSPGSLLTISWATNFQPTKIKIVSKFNNPYSGVTFDQDVLAELPGTRTTASLSYETVEKYADKWNYYDQGLYIYAYYSKDDYVSSPAFRPKAVKRDFTTQPQKGITVLPGNALNFSWSTNFQPTKIKIVSEYGTWTYSPDKTDVLAELAGTAKSYSLSYDTLTKYKDSIRYPNQKFRVYAYYSKNDYVASVSLDPDYVPRMFTTQPPSSAKVAPGDSVLLTWETNFPAETFHIVSRYWDYSDASYSYDDIATLAGTRNSYSLSYEKMSIYWDGFNYPNQCFLVLAYYSEDDYVSSSPFDPQFVSRAFMLQPQGGTVTNVAPLELHWSTNFTPVKIQIVGSFRENWNASPVDHLVDTISGTETSYSINYHKASQFESMAVDGINYYVKAFYKDDTVSYVRSNPFAIHCELKLFASVPAQDFVIEEDGNPKALSWSTYFTPDTLALMLQPMNGSTPVKLKSLSKTATGCQVSFADLDLAFALINSRADSGMLYLRATVGEKEFKSRMFHFLMNYKIEGSLGNCSWVYNPISRQLTVSGSGSMTNWSDSNGVPWKHWVPEIQKVVINNGVTSIGSNAFNGCGALTSLSLPASLTAAGNNAFTGCDALSTVIYGGSQKNWSNLSMGSGNESLRGATCICAYIDGGSCGSGVSWRLDNDNSLTISGSGAMANYDNESNKAPWAEYRNRIAKVVLKNGVTSIGAHSFRQCTVLQTVDASAADLSSVGAAAFYECSILRQVSGFDKSSLTSLGSHVFRGCRSLTYVNLSSFITAIPACAFYGCTSLSAAPIPTLAASVGEKAYYGCTGLKSVQFVQVNGQTTAIDTEAFRGCTALTSLTMPDRITTIGDRAFENCTGLKTLRLPASLVTLGEGAFSGCSALESRLSLPEGLTELKAQSFKQCAKLTEITLNSGLTSIGTEAFYGSGLSGFLTIPEGVTSIGAGAFRNTKLFTLHIPASLTTVAQNAFNGCGSLAVVYYYGLQGQWNAISIQSGNEPLLNAQRYYLGSSGTVGSVKWSLEGDGILTVYSTDGSGIPNMTAGQQPWAANAADIKKVDVLNPTVNIGANVFRDLPNLKEVYFAESLRSIGLNAFANCPSLTDVYTDANEYFWDTYVTVNEGNLDLTGDNNSKLHFSTAEAELDQNPDLKWKLEGDTLIIDSSGSGGDDWAIPDFGNGEQTPWFIYSGAIRTVRFEDCVTRIGSGTLRGLDKVTVVEIPLACKVIAEAAFDCPNLETVYYGGMSGDWSFVQIGANNNELNNANIVYGFSADKIPGADLRWSIDASGTLTIYRIQNGSEDYAIPNYAAADSKPWQE
ncbi:MAG: leucine-rich repeat domain-containing protein [Oscillospiraceae bacterium]|nr:leucine-rich repeat domain-containing protein [Oscillospiraceae bacterium]